VTRDFFPAIHYGKACANQLKKTGILGKNQAGRGLEDINIFLHSINKHRYSHQSCVMNEQVLHWLTH